MNTAFRTTHELRSLAVAQPVVLMHETLAGMRRSEGPDKSDERRSASKPAEKRAAPRRNSARPR